ncbi:hypothetical protein ACNOYE_14515 [Nannocystaceae bacterium ST9]
MSSELPPDELEWTPLRWGGASFGTHVLVGDDSRLELRPSTGAKVLVHGLWLAGVLTMAGGLFVYLNDADLGGLFVGVPMLLVGVGLSLFLRRLLTHRVFDRGLGRYWDTREGGDRFRPGPRALALAELRGVQVVREDVIGPESNYVADELNLVLADRRRINVIDHADTARLREDAGRIARWLGVPLWLARSDG